MIPESYTFMKQLDNADQVNFFQREQYWIKRLRTLTPLGLNKRRAPSLHPFFYKIRPMASPNLLKQHLKGCKKDKVISIGDHRLLPHPNETQI